MDIFTLFPGPNAAYVLEQYELYRIDPASVSPELRSLFVQLDREGGPDGGYGTVPAPAAGSLAGFDARDVAAATRLAQAIRDRGHRLAHTDPFGQPEGDPLLDPSAYGLNDSSLSRLPATTAFQNPPAGVTNAKQAVDLLVAAYCGRIGVDVAHLRDEGQRRFFEEAAEGGICAPLGDDVRIALLKRLAEVEGFEQFLHQTFQGQKRFSIEGTDALVPMIDEIVRLAGAAGTQRVVIGMSHRGRLSVLTHVLGKPFGMIFREFHAGPEHDEPAGPGSPTGDVKYHLGWRRNVELGDRQMELVLSNNASHLEFVDPVVQGITRAAQDDRGAAGAPPSHAERGLNITVHGDAAFPGEGIVAETLNLSQVPGYRTGGSIHIIANNQVGFTTDPMEGRSTIYASDLAKGFEIPVLHVSADDPEACLGAVRLAYAYRERFHHDVVIDMIGYRRFGHNEGDEPAFTQPLVYEWVATHPTVRAIYARQLTAAGVLSQADVDAMQQDTKAALRAIFEDVQAGRLRFPVQDESSHEMRIPDTKVAQKALQTMNDALLQWPQGFTPNQKLGRLLRRRKEQIAKPGGIDWAHAEALAFASILSEGIPIRFTGQDAERGTFSQRHLVLHDAKTGERHTPLRALRSAKASFDVHNSPLSETAVIGFEYGYGLGAPGTMVLWEAQFGDFANAGQVLIDQFIAAARAKWRESSAITLLLPHGYEGQGAEHSSARLERYLQLAAEDNIRVANCTTAAQYFHLLRMQAALLQSQPRPLIVMTPKSLLRHPLAGSSLEELSEGQFHPVLVEPAALERASQVERLVICSGKIAVEYVQAALQDESASARAALARVELLYPFPEDEVRELFAQFPSLEEVVWLQEEPRNMGAWSYVAPRLDAILPADVELRYAGRPERAATAEGSPEAHAQEHLRILTEALTEHQPMKLVARGEKRHAN